MIGAKGELSGTPRLFSLSTDMRLIYATIKIMLNPDKPTTTGSEVGENKQLEAKPSSEIGPEHSLPAQIRLMYYMIPNELKDLVIKSDGENLANEDEIFMVWVGSFSDDFREFWDTESDLPENKALYERVMQETQDNESLTDRDLATIVATFNLKNKELFTKKVREILLKEEELMV